MTGFGIAETETNKINIKVEVKSLNGKFFELNLRMPRQWQHKESELRRDLSKWVERGSVTVNINLSYKQAEDVVSPINADVVTYYFGLNGAHVMTLEEIGEKFNLTRERVRQIKEKAIKRLKHSSRSRLLKAYLG